MEPIAREINRLLTEAYSIVTKVEQNIFRGTRYANLTVGEVHTIEAIGENERTMGEIAAALGITLATLNTSVSRLYAKGYVQRRRTEEDRRRVLVTLTRSGRVVYRFHKQFHERLVHDIIIDMTDAEQQSLSNALAKIENYFGTAAETQRKEVRA